MKNILFLLTILVCSGAWAHSSNMRVIGKIKSFNAKAVTVDVNGQLMEFDIRRVKDKTKLKSGEAIEIDLEKNLKN